MYIIFILSGFISVIVQTLLVREVLILSEGNELMLGVVFSVWFAGAGLGSYLTALLLKKLNPEKLLKKLYLTFAIIPLVALFEYTFLVSYRPIFGIFPGEMLSPLHVLLSSFIGLFPLAMIFGSQFALGSGILKTDKLSFAGVKVYIFEAFGFFAGALVFTFFLIKVTSAFNIVVVSGVVSLFASRVIYKKAGIKKAYFILPAVFFLLVSCASFGLISSSGVSYDVNTKLARITVYPSGETTTMFYNGKYAFEYPYITSMENEEFASIPSVFCKSTSKILVIGGFSKYIEDILKIKKVFVINYIEPDLELLREIENTFVFTDRKRVNIIYDDIYGHLESKKEYYDIVYLCFDSPDTILSNSYFTGEFFNKVKKSLKSEGVFAFRVLSNEAYLNKYVLGLNRSAYLTAKDVFGKVKIVPGNENIFITHKGNPNFDLDALKTDSGDFGNFYYITPEHVRFKLSAEREKNFIEKLNIGEYKNDENKNLKPVMLWNYLMNYQAMYSPFYTVTYKALFKYWWVLLFVMVYLLSFRKINYGYISFAGGLAGLSLEIAFSFMIQLKLGSIYQLVGILSALYMSGLASGAIVSGRMTKKNDIKKIFVYLQFLFSAWILLCWAAIEFNLINPYGYFACAFITAFILGFEFPCLVRLSNEQKKSSLLDVSSGSIYACDLFGGFFAGIIIVPVLMPSLGINTVLVILLFIRFVILAVSRNNFRRLTE